MRTARTITSILFACVAWAGIPVGVVTPIAAAPPNDTRASHPVLDAYVQARQYRARVSQRQEQRADDDRRGATETSDYLIALDRDQQRFMLDTPEFRLVQDGPTLRLLARQVPGRYLEVRVDPAPDLAVLAQQAPMFFDRPLVDAALLLSDRPVAALSGGMSVTPVAVGGGVDAGHAAYRVDLREGPMTWRVTPADHLLRHAALDIDARFLEPDVSMQFEWDYDITHHNEPLPEDTFAFDTTGRTAVSTLRQLFAPGGGGSGAGGPGMVEREAPDFTLPRLDGEPFHLNEDAADVVVLHFWTTWTPGSAEQVEMVQQLDDWAKSQAPDQARVFLVGFGETAETLKQIGDDAQVTTPVLIDDQMSLADDYSVVTVPRTVVIADGKVRKAYNGVAPDFVEVLRKDVETLLAELKQETQKAEETPETPETAQAPETSETREAPAQHAGPQVQPQPESQEVMP